MWGIDQIACTPPLKKCLKFKYLNAANLLKHILHLLPPLGGANCGEYRMPDFYLMCSHVHLMKYGKMSISELVKREDSTHYNNPVYVTVLHTPSLLVTDDVGTTEIGGVSNVLHALVKSSNLYGRL